MTIVKMVKIYEATYQMDMVVKSIRCINIDFIKKLEKNFKYFQIL